MCGIVGFISHTMEDGEKKRILEGMNSRISHRGPDDDGLFVEGSIALAMRRLAILDLTPLGHQPMIDRNLGYALVYNGEIYNYRELRKELEQENHTFLGGSDTEVVLHAYAHWGYEAFRRFNGMFAMAIWDFREKKLLLARDRVGIKPLFIWQRGRELAFSSELKAILHHPQINPDIDTQALYHYLIYNSPPSPSTLLKEVRQLSPGQLLSIDQTGACSTHTFWSLPDLEADHSLSETDAIDGIEEILIDSIRLRLRSDVPVGVFLSGGVDSSLITAIASKQLSGIKTFSIGYHDQPCDESQFAETTANYLKTDHQTFWVNANHLDEKELIAAGDDPLANMTLVPFLELAKQARKEITVALGGDGGDEFFAGYQPRHLYSRIIRARNLISPTLWRMGVKTGQHIFRKGILARGLAMLDFDSPEMFLAQRQAGIPLEEVASLVHPTSDTHLPKNYGFSEKNPSFLSLNYQSARGYLFDTVLKTSDRATMRHGLEMRVPFTDYRLIEFASRIPQNIHFKKGISKYVLKKILWNYIPKKLVDRPKKGFGLPSVLWFNNEWSYLFDRYLTQEKIAQSGALNVTNVTSLLEAHKKGHYGYLTLLWRLVMFQLWWETYIKDHDNRISSDNT